MTSDFIGLQLRTTGLYLIAEALSKYIQVRTFWVPRKAPGFYVVFFKHGNSLSFASLFLFELIACMGMVTPLTRCSLFNMLGLENDVVGLCVWGWGGRQSVEFYL